jgi:small-conductance mechanosensitive channel
MLQRLLVLQRSRSSLEALEAATNDLVRHVDDDLKAVRASIRPIMTRLRALAKDPTDSGSSLKDGQREFRDLLERRKLVAAVVLPLREESALARRFAADLKGWSEVIDHESRLALQGLGLDLLGVLVALAVIFIGGALWRVAVSRYVTDARRRRVLLTARSIVVSVAVALVLIFHFTSEMTALLTALGFAAAGIAFALQNVILAVAGYFTMVAPNGIRVGDRVSLQGPFGYVHGEVEEIGFVRIKLRELVGDPLKPSGRVVVFPNSVVFTGSFFKDPASPRTS